MYATNRCGDGVVQQIGEFKDWEDIQIHVGHFADDILITFEVDYENKEKD